MYTTWPLGHVSLHYRKKVFPKEEANRISQISPKENGRHDRMVLITE
jgi:hypothetical protein